MFEKNIRLITFKYTKDFSVKFVQSWIYSLEGFNWKTKKLLCAIFIVPIYASVALNFSTFYLYFYRENLNY